MSERALQPGLGLGVDLGGTTISAVVVNSRGEVKGSSDGLTGDHHRIEDVVQRVVDHARTAMVRAGVRSDQLAAAGIGVPGEVDIERGELRSSPILPSWRRVPVAHMLQAHLAVPFAVENDANAALLGESTFGAARNARGALLMTIGTGIGGAVIIDGKIWRGMNGSAGEIGHLCVDPGGPPCWCGQRGCLGMVGSTTALTRHFMRLHQGTLPEVVDGRFVAEHFRRGDPAALAAVDRMTMFVARGIEMAACVMAPECVVLHGGIMDGLATSLVDGVRTRVAVRAYPAVLSSMAIVSAGLGRWAGAIGAAVVPQVAQNQRH